MAAQWPGRSFPAVLALLLALTGCATGSREAVRGPVVAAPEQGIATAAPAPDQPGDQPKQNQIALLMPMRGTNAPVGQSIVNAANMALLDVRDQNARLLVYDTTDGAAVAASRAIADGAALFIGPLLAADVRAVKPLAEAAGIPILTPSNDAALAGGGTYVLGFQPSQAVERVIGFARSRGLSQFAALIPAGEYGQRASAAFMRSVQGSGGRVVAVETFPRDPKKLTAAVRRLTDYQARVARATQKGLVRPDGTVAPVQERLDPVRFHALLIADNGRIAAAFQPLLSQYGASAKQRVQLLGTELWSSEPGLARLETMHGSWFASVPDSRFDQLASRYRSRFGSAPSRLASLAYDAMLLVNSLSGDWAPGERFPREKLDDPEGFIGTDGVFRFNAAGVAERGLEVREVTAGGFITISPAPASLARPSGEQLN